MEGPLIDQFEAAARWLAALSDSIADDQWDAPGLGEWDVRSLLGHSARALVTVEEYLARPGDSIECSSTIAYLSGARTVDPVVIAQRGIEAGVALGSDPATYVRALVERVPDLVRHRDPDEIIVTIAGAMTLSSYLPTRTVELIVHGCDLSRAIGVTAEPPLDALRSVVHLLAETYIETGRGPTLCLAIAGRPIGSGDLEIWPSR